MSGTFIELKSTDNAVVFIRKDSIDAFEIVPASQRVDGHVKLYVGAFKFLIAISKEDLLKKLA